MCIFSGRVTIVIIYIACSISDRSDMNINKLCSTLRVLAVSVIVIVAMLTVHQALT